jgi:hypothetical protein
MKTQSAEQADLRTRNTLDKTARTDALTVVLVTVDDFVDQNPADLICATIRAVHDVLACEVNLLGCMSTGCIGYTIHRSKDKLYGLHTISLALASSYWLWYLQPLTALVPCPSLHTTIVRLRR